MLGHTKTIAVLLASWWVFHEPMVPRKLLGMALAVAGMSAYGHSMAKKNGSSKPKSEAPEADVRATVVVAGQHPKHSGGPTAHPIRVSEGAGSRDGAGSGDGGALPDGLRARRVVS